MDNLLCPICLEELEIENKQKFKLTCGHEYHTECIIQSLRKNNECPYCRDTDGNQKISIYDSNGFNNNLISDDDELLNENDSNYDNMCELLKPVKKNLKNDIKELKIEVKRLEKNSILLLNKFKKDGRFILNEYKKEFIKNNEYSIQMDELKKWKNNCKKLKKKFIKNLKDNGIEYGSDVDEMLNNYLYEFLNDDNVWELQQGFHHFFWDLF
jgi:hypothetical protein